MNEKEKQINSYHWAADTKDMESDLHWCQILISGETKRKREPKENFKKYQEHNKTMTKYDYILSFKNVFIWISHHMFHICFYFQLFVYTSNFLVQFQSEITPCLTVFGIDKMISINQQFLNKQNRKLFPLGDRFTI